MESPTAPATVIADEIFETTVLGWEGKMEDEAKVRTLKTLNFFGGEKHIKRLFDVQLPESWIFFYAKNEVARRRLF